ncbi:predicted protein [Sclerotinia sclerotiorum 1980 UF-70]|uniref:Uncharacterized protein n=2 Tax=Sclerotinia sclerotiorum (strain ATCC 18683 / 1980 / Ss-1) TaxID=665079 RepID=A7ECD0_SCLS1|nr:predicted protein [Sclerotinia sclerotiorum 1980 UF-70]APA09085.1 hypothetical protein sscle_04g038550 [Sclerotinia sclerotiorum 1980 UF-70]EDO00109.1 predicted protein [Sclerotinia sclerotiorum 1980 UF-70]
MANQTSIWRSISWSKKNKSKPPNKDLPELDTSLANAKINSTTDPLTPPAYFEAISPRTVVDTNRRVGYGGLITPPPSPEGGISVDREFGVGYEDGGRDGGGGVGDGEGSGDREGSGEGSGVGEGSSGRNGSSQENEKSFQRSIDRDIKRMVEGPDTPNPVSSEYTEEVFELADGEKGGKRSIWRNLWRGIGIGKGKANDGSPSDSVQFNTVKWDPKEMGNDEGQDKEKKGVKQRSKSDGQAKRPKNIGGKEEISVKRRWTFPGFRKNTLGAVGAEGVEGESERLERERKEERQKRSIEHKKKYPNSVLDDIKDEYSDYKKIASSQLDEFVQAGKNLEAEAKAKAAAKAKAKARVPSRVP